MPLCIKWLRDREHAETESLQLDKMFHLQATIRPHRWEEIHVANRPAPVVVFGWVCARTSAPKRWQRKSNQTTVWPKAWQ